jgi:hypothetical protein
VSSSPFYLRTETDPVSEASCFYSQEHRTMEKIHNPSNSVCYTPSWEPWKSTLLTPYLFSIVLSFLAVLFLWPQLRRQHLPRETCLTPAAGSCHQKHYACREIGLATRIEFSSLYINWNRWQMLGSSCHTLWRWWMTLWTAAYLLVRMTTNLNFRIVFWYVCYQ